MHRGPDDQYYKNGRFQKPVEGEQYRSEYDMPSGAIYDPIQRDTSPFVVTTIDLSVAGTRLLTFPGRAFVPYYWQTNSVIKARQLSGFIQVSINRSDASDASQIWPGKYNRGFNGTFTQLYLTWSAQANTSVDFVVHREEQTPWMTDDFEAGSGVTTVTATAPIVSSGGANPNISIPVATNAVDGYLSAADHTTFSAAAAGGITSLTGDVTATGPGAAAATLATVVIPATATKITYDAKGRVTAGAALASGDIPNNASNTTGSAGSVSGTNVVTNANLVQMPTLTVKGNNTGGTANAADLTVAQVRTMVLTQPSTQVFNASGTYTVPTPAPLYIEIEAYGGGGGGGGTGTTTTGGAGGNGGDTAFGANITAGGGKGAASGNTGSGGDGGTPTLTTSGTLLKVKVATGASGAPGSYGATGAGSGGTGGSMDLGGAGKGGIGGSGGVGGAGSAGVTNSGAGGGGGGAGATTANGSAGGGGSGAYVKALLLAPTAAGTFTVTIGAAGTAGAVGTSGAAGAAGGSGYVIVTERYQ